MSYETKMMEITYHIFSFYHLTLYDLGERISSIWHFDLKKERIIVKISYERRVYESVDVRSLS